MNFISFLYLVFVGFLGIVTAYILPLPLTTVAKTLIGPALGIVIVTQITLLISLLVSFHQGSILASFILFAFLLTIYIWVKRIKLTLPRFSLRRGLYLLVGNWLFVLILSTVGAFVVYIFWIKVLTPTQYGLVTGGGGLYGDTALHSAYSMSMVEQGLPPTNPLFARIPLIYPFLVNLFSASLVKLGMNLRFAFILPQILHFLGFIVLFYLVAKRLNLIQGSTLRNANRTAFFTLVIFFLGWGLGFTEYITDVSKTGSFLPTREYTNNLPGFHMHNVFTGLIFPERSFLPGLFIGTLITILCIDFFVTLRKRSDEAISEIATRTPSDRNDILKAILIGILLGILPLWHTHTFLFFSAAVGAWYFSPLLLHLEGGRLKRSINHDSPEVEGSWQASFRSIFIIYSIAFLLALPVFLWFGQQISHESFIRFSLGWMDSKTNPLFFWFKNTGLLIPLALLGVVFFKRNLKAFFIPVLLMFFIANSVVFQPWDWDNIKLFSWIFLFCAIAAGYGLHRISQIRLIGLIWPVVLLTLAASGTLSLAHLVTQEFGIYSHDDIQLAEWVKTHSPKKAVFLIDPWPNHPIPGLTGRSVYMGYPGHLWVHGIKYGEREALTNRVLNGDIGALRQTRVPIDFIVAEISRKPKLTGLPIVYENQKLAIFQVP